MPYRLKPDESVPEGLKRIVCEEVEDAHKQLAHAKNRDKAIHEARKSMKKIRGLLRLVKTELGNTYKAENTRLRDIGRKLSELRDAQAIIETFDKVIEEYKVELRKPAFSALRRGLLESKRNTERTLHAAAASREAIRALRSLALRSKKWPLKTDGFLAVAPGVEERFRRGKKAMTRARKDPSPENYHEWRKRVKDHWYHVRLFEGLWTDVMQAHENSLKKLETWLGDDHNLVVLSAKIQDGPEQYGRKEEVQLFLALAGRYQKELREKAQVLGKRVYQERPRRLVRQWKNLWDAWKSQPGSMKQEQHVNRKSANRQPAKTAGPAKRAAA